VKFTACRRKVYSPYSILKMEDIITTETSVKFCQSRHYYSLNVDNLHSYRLRISHLLNPVFHETRICLGENRVLEG